MATKMASFSKGDTTVPRRAGNEACKHLIAEGLRRLPKFMNSEGLRSLPKFMNSFIHYFKVTYQEAT